MNKSDASEITLDSLRKNIVINIDRMLIANNELVHDYETFLINFIKEAIKDNCVIYFLIEFIDETPNLKSRIDTNDNMLFLSCENINYKSKKNKTNPLKKINKLFSANGLSDEFNKCFYFIKNKTKIFNSFLKNKNFIATFTSKNTIFVSDDPAIAENLFFHNFFSVFLSSLDININNSDYRSAKKICQCLIDKDISNWDYDRINYDFMSFLEMTIK